MFSRVDDSNTSIGKRYARNDELGTPFGITVDFASVQKRTITLRCVSYPRHSFTRCLLASSCRERDTTDQRIGTVDEVIEVVSELVQGDIDWAQACTRLPAYDGVQAID